MKKAVVTIMLALAFFAFAEEKKANVVIALNEYNAIQFYLNDARQTMLDSLDGSHQTIKRLSQNLLAIQQFLKERTDDQFAEKDSLLTGPQKDTLKSK